MNATLAWTEAELPAGDLLLDALNPRIDVPANATQEEIRLQLLKHEAVVELAKDIKQSGGLLPGERIITWFNGTAHVVLEGNRRVAACQMLVDPTLVPPSYRSLFPRADSETLILNISRVKADVAPSREAAEPLITKRHTEPGIKPWSPAAKMRRVVRWIERGETLTEVARRLKASPATIRKSIKGHYLLQLALNLPVWKPDERDALQKESTPINPYVRFFELQGVREILRLNFDASGRPSSTLPTDVFNAAIEHIARAFLIPDPTTGKPWANTRTTPDQVFDVCPVREQLLGPQPCRPATTAPDATDFSATSATSISGAPAHTPSKRRTGRESWPGPPRFFETVECFLADDLMRQLTTEIRLINHTRTPIAATFLLRALLESALKYQIRKSGCWDQLLAQSKKGDPGLEMLIRFACEYGTQVFKEKRAGDLLQAFRGSGYKDYFDLVVHGDWARADPILLETAANLLRPLISYILADERREVLIRKHG